METNGENEITGKNEKGRFIKGHNVGFQKGHKGFGNKESYIKRAIKISKSLQGKKLSKEHIKKLKESHKGKRLSEETKNKMSIARKGLKRSKEFKKRLSESRRGNKCNFWKGGISKITFLIRECFKYRQWRSDVFTRDNFICRICNQRGGILNADHIKAFSSILKDNNIKSVEKALNCEELWNINNGRTLCEKCHKLTDNYGRRNKQKSSY